MTHLRPALVLLILFTVLTGLAYPLAVTGIAQIAFPAAANGSLLRDQGGAVVGSALIGQNFTADGYLHPRPSATSAPDPTDSSKTIDAPYNGASSAGSNLGPTSRALAERLTASAEAMRAAGAAGPIPADAITTSASGLDPDISPAFAALQAPRIATARGKSLADVEAALATATAGRMLGFVGEPRVNVLEANRALDARFGSAVKRP